MSTATVSMGDIQIRIPALGTITPLATVTVRTQISGQLQKIAFKEGQLVKQGDFLAQIDPRPYEATLAQAQGTLRKDQSLLADARLDLKRFEELIKEDSVAQQQLDTQRALVEQYEGTIERTRRRSRRAQINLAYCHITSPVTGRIGLRQVDEGNYVTPGDTNGIAVVTQLQPDHGHLRHSGGQRRADHATAAQRRAAAGGSLRPQQRQQAGGRQAGHRRQPDRRRRPAPSSCARNSITRMAQLFPNQFVNIQLLQDTLHDQTLMPTAAVHRGAPNGVNSTFVYRIKDDSTAAVVPVKLGVADGETVGVLSGVSVGDVVVTEGGDRLRDGAQVELPANTPVHDRAEGDSGSGRQAPATAASVAAPGRTPFRPR